MNNPITVPLQLFRSDLTPHLASAGSAAYDLRLSEACSLAPGATALLSTGIKLAIPEGYQLVIRPRSGLSWQSRLRIANSPGTIDADFRDELKVIMENRFSQEEIPVLIAEDSPLLERFGPFRLCSLEDYLLRQGKDPSVCPESLLHHPIYLNEAGELWGTENLLAGERICQCLLLPLWPCDFQEVSDVHRYGHDRGGGFGHSGRL